jgi:hypothetical protein
MYNDVVAKRRLEPVEPPKPKARKPRWPWLVGMALILVIAAAAILSTHHPNRAAVSSSPVPANIVRAVNFKVYYPDQSKLPAGYTFDKNSFANPVSNGISYEVNYDNGKKIVFSLQSKPADNELQVFNSNYIPLRTDYQTAIGQAEIGAYNNHGKVQSLVSLPTHSSTWIVITAPYDIDQAALKQILNSLKS